MPSRAGPSRRGARPGASLLSHGLPRSSGRRAQIRVSGFSPLIVTFQVSSVRKQSQEADHIRAQPTSWSGHRPCPKFTCPCLWCACLLPSDSCPGFLRIAQWTGRVRTSHVWFLANLRDLWSLMVLGPRGVRRLECRAALSRQPRHGCWTWISQWFGEAGGQWCLWHLSSHALLSTGSNLHCRST